MTKIILSGLTSEQLKGIVIEAVVQGITSLSTHQTSIVDIKESKRYIYSIRGLAKFMKCSPTTAQSWKNKGVIPFRQSPHSKRFIFNESDILEAMAKNGLSKTYKS